MSKLIDKLQNVSKSSMPIGFHAAISKSTSPPMLLIAGLSGTDAEEVKIVAASDVDAGLILNQNLRIENVERMVKAMGGIPLGVFIKDINKEEAAELPSLGCDFVVFDVKTSVVALQEKEIGKILLVEPSLDQGLVRAIDSFDVDGMLINRGEESFITVEYLLVCRRFSALLDKPLVAALPPSVTGAELGNLWKCGISGIVVPSTQPAKAFAELRKIINNLSGETKRPRSKASVVLPQYGIAAEREEEEEEI
jgi:hypothetical protein